MRPCPIPMSLSLKPGVAGAWTSEQEPWQGEGRYFGLEPGGFVLHKNSRKYKALQFHTLQVQRYTDAVILEPRCPHM